MYICLFTRAKSGREMTNCILSLLLRNVTDNHLCGVFVVLIDANFLQERDLLFSRFIEDRGFQFVL